MNPATRRMLATASLVLASMVLSPSRPAAAQCSSGWEVGAGVPGTNAIIYAMMMWDPDGAGPQPPRLVAGGQFTAAGGVVANRIAQWDPTTGAWSAMGSGMNDYVLCLAAMPNGDLIAGGGFSTADGATARYIARWNGTTWSPLTTPALGLNGDVYSLTLMANGDLVAGGIFNFAAFTLVNYVARWDGVAWLPMSPMSTGMDNYVLASTLLPSGDLVVGGYFTTADGVAANYVARWNGASWLPMGAGTNSNVFALARMGNGDIVAGGLFQSAGGMPANRIARWSPAGGGSWSTLGAGMNYEVRALAVLPGGDVVAAGLFSTAGGAPANYVARWNGSSWSAVGTGTSSDVRALATLPGGGFVAGGNFSAAGGSPALHFARSCAGATWSAFGSGCAGLGGVPVLTLVSSPQLGSTFTLAVQNLGGGVPLMIVGLSPQSLPLLSLGFGAACTLLAAPDLLEVLVPVAGSSSWSLAIPNVPALAGIHLWNQVAELGTVSAVSNGGDGQIGW